MTLTLDLFKNWHTGYPCLKKHLGYTSSGYRSVRLEPLIDRLVTDGRTGGRVIRPVRTAA